MVIKIIKIIIYCNNTLSVSYELARVGHLNCGEENGREEPSRTVC